MIARAKINPKMMEWARIHAGFVNGYEDTLPLEIKNRYENRSLYQAGSGHHRSPS